MVTDTADPAPPAELDVTAARDRAFEEIARNLRRAGIGLGVASGVLCLTVVVATSLRFPDDRTWVIWVLVSAVSFASVGGDFCRAARSYRELIGSREPDELVQASAVGCMRVLSRRLKASGAFIAVFALINWTGLAAILWIRNRPG